MKRFPTKLLHIAIFAALTAVSAAAAPLRFGILPDADSLPFMVASDEGLFAAQGVEVELVRFTNPQERDAAFQAGRIDGAISDLLAAAFFAAGGFDAKVTSRTDGRYGIVASPSSGITSAAGLRGRKIGLSTNTIIQYSVDALLSAAGIPMEAYEAVSVPRIPVRLELVLSGGIDGAGLPEPLLTAAVARGAVLVASTEESHIDAGVVLFSKRTMDRRLEELRAFYRAYAAACARINGRQDAYRAYLVEKAGFPVEIRDSYRFVRYLSPALPETAQVQGVLDWLKKRGLLSRALSPAELLDGRAIAGF